MASQSKPLTRIHHSRKQKSTSTPLIPEFEITCVSSVPGKVIRKSEVSNYLKKSIFPHSLFESLSESFSNPFFTKNQLASCFMNDLVTFVRAAEYSMEGFIDMNPFDVVYKSGSELNSNEFHEKVDGVAPVALLIFFDSELTIGITYCTPLEKNRELKDMSMGYFTLYKGELISCKISTNQLNYTEQGFLIPDTFFLNMSHKEESIGKVKVGKDRTKLLDEVLPNWPKLIEGLVVLKLI